MELLQYRGKFLRSAEVALANKYPGSEAVKDQIDGVPSDDA
jgi:hypothetical protein